MKITLDAAMRARDVSRPQPRHEAAAQDVAGGPDPGPARQPAAGAVPGGLTSGSAASGSVASGSAASGSAAAGQVIAGGAWPEEPSRRGPRAETLDGGGASGAGRGKRRRSRR